ncbi:MAG: hypothetical protein N2C14_00165 [Planctomycetales bacterium]
MTTIISFLLKGRDSRPQRGGQKKKKPQEPLKRILGLLSFQAIRLRNPSSPMIPFGIGKDKPEAVILVEGFHTGDFARRAKLLQGGFPAEFTLACPWRDEKGKITLFGRRFPRVIASENRRNADFRRGRSLRREPCDFPRPGIELSR